MGTLLIMSAISAGSVAFLIYFGFSLWRDERKQRGKRVLVLRFREIIARKRNQQRLLYMHKLETIGQPLGERARKL